MCSEARNSIDSNRVSSIYRFGKRPRHSLFGGKLSPTPNGGGHQMPPLAIVACARNGTMEMPLSADARRFGGDDLRRLLATSSPNCRTSRAPLKLRPKARRVAAVRPRRLSLSPLGDRSTSQGPRRKARPERARRTEPGRGLLIHRTCQRPVEDHAEGMGSYLDQAGGVRPHYGRRRLPVRRFGPR
jgi:hypothetical protein